MKYIPPAALALACLAGHAASPPQPQRPPPMPLPVRSATPAVLDLRQAVEQYHPGMTLAPRRLTAAERAELRRQLSEYAQPATPSAAPFDKDP